MALAACAGPTVPKLPPWAQADPQTILEPTTGPGTTRPPETEAAVPEPPPETAPDAITEALIDQPIKVALLLPLSGRHAALGESLLNAAQLALFDVAEDRFSLIVRDTRGTPDGARGAARAALDAGARLVLGPVFATSVSAMAGAARAQGVSVIAFSNDRSVADGGTFVMGLGPQPQIDRLIGYARRQGLVRFAVLTPQSAYGNAVLRALQEAVTRYGGELSRVVSYRAGLSDLTEEVRALADYDARHADLVAQRELLAEREDEASQLALERLEGLDTIGVPDFDAVLLPQGGKRLQTIAPLLAYYDVDPAEVRFLGTAHWDDVRLGTEPALAGGWFTAPPPDLWRSFRDRYKETYDKVPPRIAALAYDATALAAVLTRRALQNGQDPDFGPVVLTQPSGFAGIDGVFRFLPTGEVQRRLAVLELRRDGFQVLDRAPNDFRQIGF